MEKILKSGLKVDDKQYYKLLEWKDKNYHKFLFFCSSYRLRTNSINEMDKETYNSLIQFSNQ